jgi:hypothetical protein
MFKRFKFSFLVLLNSLKLPLEILVIVIFSGAVVYSLFVGYTSFALWELKYLSFEEWDEIARLIYAIIVTALSFTIFGNRKKLL